MPGWLYMTRKSNLQSKITNSFNQGRKSGEKTNIQFSQLVIARLHGDLYGPDRCQTTGNCLPHLSRQPRAFRNERKREKTKAVHLPHPWFNPPFSHPRMAGRCFTLDLHIYTLDFRVFSCMLENLLFPATWLHGCALSWC